MIPDSQVLTVAQMRAAEQSLIDRGESVSSLMERAGQGVADWVWRLAAGRPVTILCGPGNNGGDGYVAARELARRGTAVTVVAPLAPVTDAAVAARRSWAGTIDAQGRGGVLVDCLFGSGLSRPLSPELQSLLGGEADRHALRVAVDVPSGVDSDSGATLGDRLPHYELTLALGAWKPAHALMPAMAIMGEKRLVPIGVAPVEGAAHLLAPPGFAPPARDAHKYTRGMVMVVEGPLPGAALLASEGAMRAGAGTVRLAARDLHPAASPDLVLKPQPLAELLEDERLGAVLVGPGLGRDDEARGKLAAVLAAGRASVIDADALTLLDPELLRHVSVPLILTPHEGEMKRLAASFGTGAEVRVERARELAVSARAVVIAKGPDTVIAAPDGRLAFAPSPTSWLSVAGTGDVLAGIAASRLATGRDPFTAACEAVWLHGDAARRSPVPFTASELARQVAAAYASRL